MFYFVFSLRELKFLLDSELAGVNVSSGLFFWYLLCVQTRKDWSPTISVPKRNDFMLTELLFLFQGRIGPLPFLYRNETTSC